MFMPGRYRNCDARRRCANPGGNRDQERRAFRRGCRLRWWKAEFLEFNKAPEILDQAVRGLAFAVNRPLQQRPSHHRLDGACQRIGIGPQQLARFDGFVEQRLDAGPHLARVRERVALKIRIEEIHLQEREAVRQRLGRVGHCRDAVGERVQRRKRRRVPRANGGELGADVCRSGGGEGEQQPALRSEALEQRRRRDAGFFRDVAEGEVRPEARDDTMRRGEQILVAGAARAGAHRRRL